MEQPENSLMAKIMPFIGMGVFIVLFVIGIIIFSYILLWGSIIGLVLFVIYWVKTRFFTRKKRCPKPGHEAGRTFDHEEF